MFIKTGVVREHTRNSQKTGIAHQKNENDGRAAGKGSLFSTQTLLKRI
jgi:hypothetical protein